MHPAVAQRLDGRAGLWQRRIVKRQHGMHPLAPADIDHRMAARFTRSPALGQIWHQRPAQLVHQGGAAGRYRLTVRAATDAAARHDPNVADGERL